MKAIWLANLPIPPSVNSSLIPTAIKKFSQRTGKQYYGGYMRSSDEMRIYKDLMKIYHSRHREGLKKIGETLTRAVELGWVLQVDSFVAFHESRVYSHPNKKILQIDANNRAKAILDGVVKLVGIDDAVFFRGDCEKVTTASKESECVMVRIQPVRARSLDQIKAMMKLDLKNDSSQT